MSGFVSFSGRIPTRRFGDGLALAGLSCIVAFVIVDLFTILGKPGEVISYTLSLVWTAAATWAMLADASSPIARSRALRGSLVVNLIVSGLLARVGVAGFAARVFVSTTGSR